MATGAGAYPEPVIPWLSKSRLRLVAVLVLLAAFYSASWHLAKVDPAKLLSGLPRMASWTGKAWPPAMDELPVLLQRTGEAIAMAAIGTTAAALLALPLSVLAARNVTPSMAVVGLFWWEFNVRASTVLGVVGAGGIGQELKNSMDLLLFPRLLTILVLILVTVTVIDQTSAWLRRRLE